MNLLNPMKNGQSCPLSLTVTHGGSMLGYDLGLVWASSDPATLTYSATALGVPAHVKAVVAPLTTKRVLVSATDSAGVVRAVFPFDVVPDALDLEAADVKVVMAEDAGTYNLQPISFNLTAEVGPVA